MKRLEVRQKYSAARRILNSLLSVSSGDEKPSASHAWYITLEIFRCRGPLKLNRYEEIPIFFAGRIKSMTAET